MPMPEGTDENSSLGRQIKQILSFWHLTHGDGVVCPFALFGSCGNQRLVIILSNKRRAFVWCILGDDCMRFAILRGEIPITGHGAAFSLRLAR